MEVYTLNPIDFLKVDLVEEYISCIWTERYSSAGDVKISVPATPKTVSQLKEGSLLSIPDSKEVMMVETQTIDDGILTSEGNSLLGFLNERVVRFASATSHVERSATMMFNTPGMTIADLVQQMAIDGDALDETEMYVGVGQSDNKIPNLQLGYVDNSGSAITVAVSYGPLYSAIRELAESYGLGISLYLDSATTEGYSLLFTVYKGADRTSSQSVNGVVRFSPAMGSLSKVKELRSISGYKTVAYAFAPNKESSMLAFPGEAYADGVPNPPLGFDRRVLMVFAEDISEEQIAGDLPLLNALLAQRARDALANNNYTRIVDGEVVPQSQYKYGVHYKLGDVIELQGYSEIISKARITEYIRSQDETGERAYPTVSIVEDGPIETD